MHISQYLSLSLTLLLASPALANPVSQPSPETNLLSARQGFNGLTCGPNKYTVGQAQDAYGDGIKLMRSNRKAGNSPYPKEFRNGSANRKEVDPGSCAGLQLYEFPILRGGREYTSGDPGPDRVVFGDSNKKPGAYVQCFLTTHNGMSGLLVRRCT